MKREHVEAKLAEAYRRGQANPNPRGMTREDGAPIVAKALADLLYAPSTPERGVERREETIPCSTCKGGGRVGMYEDRCSACKGSGCKLAKRIVEIREIARDDGYTPAAQRDLEQSALGMYGGRDK